MLKRTTSVYLLEISANLSLVVSDQLEKDKPIVTCAGHSVRKSTIPEFGQNKF